MFLGQFFVQNAKNEHFLNGSNWTNFENRENAEIAGNSVKMALFDLQNTKTRPFFQDAYMKLCTHKHLPGFFDTYFGFRKFRKFPQKMKIFRNFRNFQNSRQQFDRKVHSQPSVEAQSFVSFKMFA